MTLRDDLLPVLHQVRSIPGQLGLRAHSVKVVVTASGGARIGEGSETPAETNITESGGHNPKVRLLTAREIAAGGYDAGTIEIGPITPSFAGGGTLWSALDPEPPSKNTVRFRITGPMWPTGAWFTAHERRGDRPFRYSVIAQRSS